ncbi:phage antirepressor KilAC domain-containing protein [Burkholderia mayonis]|uniref:Phage antirepressor Ant n=1 Tax=Burkholderia mayonis TaxID=1385591 RepID=A0A1B4G141_9BURK|nr:phage antirepressor KilAC domain-containing protein [Burkholderia mayonis]AOJ09632.1 hypothetical protein WS71_20160 [Burkholderia mayonis]KVE52253.1 hypothetical protein WS71_09985 [Burkholderia mayonis]
MHEITIADRRVGDESRSVNARDLHAFLGVRKDFSDWIKAQLADIFSQRIDYEVFPQPGESGRPRVEYALTLACAKHIAMMSRTAKGVEARDYFIECERRARTAAPALPNFSDPIAAARAWADAKEAEQRASVELAQARPAVAFVERYANAAGTKGFREVCKLLRINENEFREFLTEQRVMYRLGGRLVPYQPHIDAGRFEIKAGVTTDERAHAYSQTRFTPKGIAWIAGLWYARAAQEAA